MAGALYQFNIFPQFQSICTQSFIEQGVINTLDDLRLLGDVIFAGFVKVYRIIKQVIDAFEPAAHADRPGDRRALDTQHGFNLIEQIDGVTRESLEGARQAARAATELSTQAEGLQSLVRQFKI